MAATAAMAFPPAITCSTSTRSPRTPPPPADGTGLRPPQDQNGGQFLPNGVFGTVFYPNTLDPRQATSLPVAQGSVIASQNFTVQSRDSVPAYDLITASYLDRSEERRVGKEC